MFEGKMLRGETGTPMRRIERAKSSFAEAEPEPLTLANLTTKSLTALMVFTSSIVLSGFPLRFSARGTGVGNVEQELLHVPGAGRAALGAQPAVQAHVLVLHHDTPGLEPVGDVEILRGMQRRRGQPRAQLRFLAVLRERDAVHRADIDARVAFDAELRREHRLHVAVQAPLRFRVPGLRVETELDLDLDVAQRDLLVAPRHRVAHLRGDRVVVAPLVYAH